MKYTLEYTLLNYLKVSLSNFGVKHNNEISMKRHLVGKIMQIPKWDFFSISSSTHTFEMKVRFENKNKMMII